MQELLGRISRLDPSASLGLRVIACFDELVVGNVNTRALLSAAASLAGCIAGFRQHRPDRTVRITPRGELLPAAELDLSRWIASTADEITVWLERDGDALPNDAIILERLALAVRIRHGRGHAGSDNRRDLGLLVDQAVPVAERLSCGAALGLLSGHRYRVLAAPLFAVWTRHPNGPEDVVPTVHGPLHVIVVPEHAAAVEACPVGVGAAAEPDELHHSFRTALVALRLCEPPVAPVIRADDFGGIVNLLADAPDSQQPDAVLLDGIVCHPWGLPTVDAVIRSQSVRQAARLAGVHHSTMQSRVDTIAQVMGFNPFDGFGKPRLATAYLVRRIRHSRVLDLPAPTVTEQASG